MAAMDRISPKQRSSLMARIRATNTGPELTVRRIVFAMGFRYRLHRRDLPGRPDIVFPSRKKVVFVHGCFWHGHRGCSRTSIPKTRTEYWGPKIARNKNRDKQHLRELARAGWHALVLWECELANTSAVERKLLGFLTK